MFGQTILTGRPYELCPAGVSRGQVMLRREQDRLEPVVGIRTCVFECGHRFGRCLFEGQAAEL